MTVSDTDVLAFADHHMPCTACSQVIGLPQTPSGKIRASARVVLEKNFAVARTSFTALLLLISLFDGSGNHNHHPVCAKNAPLDLNNVRANS